MRKHKPASYLYIIVLVGIAAAGASFVVADHAPGREMKMEKPEASQNLPSAPP